MKTRKPVVCWAVVDAAGDTSAHYRARESTMSATADARASGNYRLVKLTEVDRRTTNALVDALKLAYHHLDRFGCAESRIPNDPIIPSQERFFEAYHAAMALLPKRDGGRK